MTDPAVEAITALRALMEYDDFDPGPIFDMVARNLLRSHGDTALIFADSALDRMRVLGDDEGYELWEEIRRAMNIYFEFDEEEPRRVAVH